MTRLKAMAAAAWSWVKSHHRLVTGFIGGLFLALSPLLPVKCQKAISLVGLALQAETIPAPAALVNAAAPLVPRAPGVDAGTP